jgi:hypothetical protein
MFSTPLQPDAAVFDFAIGFEGETRRQSRGFLKVLNGMGIIFLQFTDDCMLQ